MKIVFVVNAAVAVPEESTERPALESICATLRNSLKRVAGRTEVLVAAMSQVALRGHTAAAVTVENAERCGGLATKILRDFPGTQVAVMVGFFEEENPFAEVSRAGLPILKIVNAPGTGVYPSYQEVNHAAQDVGEAAELLLKRHTKHLQGLVAA